VLEVEQLVEQRDIGVEDRRGVVDLRAQRGVAAARRHDRAGETRTRRAE
jgi:hypothetical protein